ncbi:MAG: DUF4115 domain-containing protein [Gammaproteobacteria bacterium]|nr:DUF4115 domain-containing protein [Gammaproteobacteria bacterium]
MTASQQEHQDELHTAPAGGPGARLRELRISRKLSLEDVAAQLRLDPPRLEALENDAYDQLPGPTFVRGYLRGYARTVGVPAGPLLEAYDRFGYDAPALIPDITSRPQIRSSDVPVKLVTYVLAVLLAVLVGVWWFSHREQALEPRLEPEPVEEAGRALPEAVERADRPVVLPPPPAPFVDAPMESEVLPDAPEPTSPPEEAQAPREEGVEARSEAPESAEVVETEPAAEGETGGDAQAPPDEPATAVAEPAVPAGRLEMSFVHDSWVEVRDATGESLFFGTAKGGDTVDVTGEPPLGVVLGYAHEVEVEYNDRSFDHRPFIDRGLARFTLGGE